MANTITVNTLHRAFSGVIHNAQNLSFAKLGADYKEHQNAGSLVWRFFNAIRNMLPTNRFINCSNLERDYKEAKLAESLLAITTAILKSTSETDDGIYLPIQFEVANQLFSIHVGTNGSLSLRHGNEGFVELECTLAELKSAMLKEYIAVRKVDDSDAYEDKLSFSEFDLSGTTVSGLTYDDYDFSRAKLHNTMFIGCDFSHCNFCSSSLTGAVFHNCDLTCTNFFGSNLNGCYFRGSTLSFANFTASDLTQTGFASILKAEHVTFDDATDGFVPNLKFDPLSTLRDPENSTDLKSKHGFATTLDSIISTIGGYDTEIETILVRAWADMQKIQGEPTISDWARISIELDKVTGLLNAKRDDDRFVIKKTNLGVIRKGLGHLALISRVAWSELAHEKIVGELTKHYTKRFDFAHTDFTTLGASLGVSPVQLMDMGIGHGAEADVSFGLSYGNRVGTVVDDEGYVGHADLHMLEGTSNAGLSVLGYGAQVSLKISRSLKGIYTEWGSGEHYVLDKFAELTKVRHWIIQKIFKSPGDSFCKRYLNRSTTVDAASRDVSAKSDMSEFHHVIKKYNNEKDDIASFFSFFYNTLQASPDPAEKAKVKLDSSAAKKAGDPFKANMTLSGLKFAAGAGDVRALRGSGDFINSNVSVGGELAYQKTSLEFTRFKSPVSKITELYQEYRKTKDPQTLEKLKAMRAAWKAASDSVCKKLSVLWTQNDSDKANSAYLLNSAELLKKDFAEYVRFEKLADRDVTAKASIDQFHRLYGVKDRAGFLACMAVLHADVYSDSLLEIIAKRDAGLDDDPVCAEGFDDFLGADGLRFEELLLSRTSSAEERVKVKQLCFHRFDAHFYTSDHKVTFMVSLPVALKDGQSVMANVAVTVQHRTRIHHHEFRSGAHVDISIGGGFTLGLAAMSYLTPALKKHGVDESIVQRFQTDPQSILNGSTYAGRIQTWCFYKPQFFPELGYRHLITKGINSTEETCGVALPSIHVAPGVSLKPGIVADVSKTSLGYITYSPGTFFHFAMIYVHEFGTGRMKQNGELPEDCYWNIAKLEQRKSLEALFNNVNGTGEEGEAIKAALLNELNVIEDTLAKKSGGDFTIEKQMLDAKKTVFLDAVEAYVSAEEVQKESKFNYAVKALEGLFRLYNTHIDRCKGISPVYKEKGLDLSGMEKAIKVKGKKITDKPVSVDNAKSGHSSMHRDEPTDHAGPVTDAVDEQLFGG